MNGRILQVPQDQRHILRTATATERSPSVIEGPELQVYFCDIPNAEMH